MAKLIFVFIIRTSLVIKLMFVKVKNVTKNAKLVKYSFVTIIVMILRNTVANFWNVNPIAAIVAVNIINVEKLKWFIVQSLHI